MLRGLGGYLCEWIARLGSSEFGAIAAGWVSQAVWSPAWLRVKTCLSTAPFETSAAHVCAIPDLAVVQDEKQRGVIVILSRHSVIDEASTVACTV